MEERRNTIKSTGITGKRKIGHLLGGLRKKGGEARKLERRQALDGKINNTTMNDDPSPELPQGA